VESFDRALGLDASYVQAYTAKGIALEGMGKLDKAVESLERAAAINPNDPLNATLVRRSMERLSEERAIERRVRIDALIADLVKAYREGPPVPASPPDPWSSRPLYLFFTELQPMGQPAPREGEDAFLFEQLNQYLLRSKRIRLVDRTMLDRLLEELKLGQTELADPNTALRVGRILAARIIATVSIVRYGGELQVTLKAIDTETTLVVAVASGSCAMVEDPLDLLERLTHEFQGWIEAAYPIRGRIAEIRDE
jgi:tetratricopeptide (TPR) repeat protein